MGGRILAGVGQLILAIIGFVFFIMAFLQVMKVYYSLGDEDAIVSAPPSYGRYLLPFVLFFGAAWLWSLLTSISLIRNAKVPEPPPPGSIPPRITK